jgi:hypothetical protein
MAKASDPPAGNGHRDDGSGDQPPPTPQEPPIVTAVDALTLEQARQLSGRRGARLVLVMGEAGTGKTALFAALWQRLIEQDGLAGHRLAGSRTALGFERRAHWQRLDCGQSEARFPPTPPGDAVLLHLRVRRPDGERVELLLSDLAGEQFERVREGRPLRAEIPWAARADRFVIIVDGEALSRAGESEIAVTRVERLLRSLQTASAVRERARVALVLTKADTLSAAGESAVARHESPLADVARESDPEATWIRTAALAPAGADPQGLGALTAWLCGTDRSQAPVPGLEAAAPRSIAAFPG